MTCREVMTPNPSCCVPSDSVAMAAQIMKREDVGPVPVVSDYNSRRLVGILTDRDLALSVVADGRDPHNTRVDEVMTRNPVTCREDDNTSDAIRLMSEHQVRRVPIVDEVGSLTGIIAQADLARYEDEEDVGELVEDISQPYGGSGWDSGRERFDRDAAPASSRNIAGSLAMGAACLGVGAAVMYLLDPGRGRARRNSLRDKASSLASTSTEAIGRTTRDVRNRATGLVAGTKSWWREEEVDDDRLVARVRSKMGRYVSHPHAIRVEAGGGHVILTGSILAHEATALLNSVKGVAGVKSVENRLETQEGSSSASPSSGVGTTQTWSPSARVMASAVGGSLLLYGLRTKSNVGKATATLGFGLLTRGLTNKEMGDLGAVGNVRRLFGY